MRYIDTTELYQKSYRWGNTSTLWKSSSLQEDFREYTNHKCWYTESPLGGSDKPIDHFRPKGRIAAFEKFDYNKPIELSGYDWLKNDFRNYRLCCTYANRKTNGGGKGCYFPLMTNTYSTDGGREVEEPVLLDPLVEEDVKLLSFFKKDINATKKDLITKKRVAATIKIYNLDHNDFDKPRLTIWEQVSRYLAQYNRNNDEVTFIENLKELVSKKSPYSACAISAVKSLVPKTIQEQLDLAL